MTFVRKATHAVSAAAAIVTLLAAASPASAAIPTLFAQSANISGSGKTINVTRVPVRDAAGRITYKDIVLQFDVSNTGVVTLGAASPAIMNSPRLNVAGFRAGIYKDSLKRHVRLAGPASLSGGRTTWTLTWIDPDGTYNFNANWATGAVTGHPNEATLKTYGITATPYSWGIVGANYGFLSGWYQSYILGAAQLGDTLTLHYFHNDTAEDAAWVFTRCPAGNLC